MKLTLYLLAVCQPFILGTRAGSPPYDPRYKKVHCVQYDGVDCQWWLDMGGSKACCMDVPPSRYQGYYLTCDPTTKKFVRSDCGQEGKICLYKNPNDCYRTELFQPGTDTDPALTGCEITGSCDTPNDLTHGLCCGDYMVYCNRANQWESVNCASEFSKTTTCGDLGNGEFGCVAPGSD